MSDEKENIKELVLRMAKKDRIVYTDLEGFTSVNLDKWLDSQPVDGLLYDLNRLGEVALTFMEKDIKWVNDFAVGLVIERLHERDVANKAKLTRQEEALQYALDKIFELIPDENTTESPEEYYERVTEGDLPMLYDTLLKKKKSAIADAGEVS